MQLLGGCRSRSDLVEAELRAKDRELREVKGRLEQVQIVNDALEHELYAGRAPAVPPGVATEAQVAPAVTGLKDIVLGRGTGGVDVDHAAGDDALQVVVTPRDEDATAVKVIGSLHVEAFEISPQGTKVPLSSWDIPASQLRGTWRSGLFSSGFQVVLPWKRVPNSERLRVVAQLLLPDGRVYEADRDITIRLPAVPPRVDPSPVPMGAPLRPEALPAPQPQGPSLSRLRPAELGQPRPATSAYQH